MGHLVINGVNDRALAKLEERARRRGVPLDQVIREIIEADALLSPGARAESVSSERRAERQEVAHRMAEIRARTLKPLWADSTLMIREDRDTR